MKKILLVTLFSAVSTFAVQAQERPREGSCLTQGTAVFRGVPESRTDIIPSVHRQMTGLGLMAVNNNCSVVITCVADPALGSEGKKIRDRMCSAVRYTMPLYETRRNMRSPISKSYTVVKENADEQWQAGTIYVTLR
jgi:hypothetical protein